MEIIKKIIKKLIQNTTNGVILIIIGIMHTQFALSKEVFGQKFLEFSKSYFFKISKGTDELPIVLGQTNLDAFAAFWFFYFGILLFPLGMLLHSIEKDGKIIPTSFTISYLIVVIIGCYMIPNSGMTVFMLPHAIYMLVRNFLKAKKNILFNV